MSESKFLQNVLKDLNEPGTVKRTYGIGAPSGQSDQTLHPMPSAMPEVLLSPSEAPSTEISPSSDRKALSEDATPPIEQTKALVATRKDSGAPRPPNPQSDFWDEMRKATERQNDFSRNIESTERLNKHREKMEEEAAVNELRASLSLLQIRPLRRSLEVEAAFPIDCLPEPAAAFVEGAASGNSALQTMRGVGLIGATAAAARGNWAVREANGHSHLLSEYILIVGPSGVGKSSVARCLRQPFEEFQTANRQRFGDGRDDPEVAARLAMIKITEAAAKKKMAAILKDTGDADAAVNGTLEDFERAQVCRKWLEGVQANHDLLLDRITMAQLPFELAAMGGVAAIIDPEGAILGQLRPSDSTILLKAFSGEHYSSATRNNGCVEVDDPCLTLCLFVQPDKAKQFYNNPKVVDHGLAARFLPVLVSDRFATNHSYLQPFPPAETEWYRNMIRTLLAIPRVDEESRIRPRAILSPACGAERVLAAFRGRLLEGGMAGQFDFCRAFVTRLPDHAIRIAGVLHLMANPGGHDHVIDQRTMENAVVLAEFFLRHAVVAFDPSAHDAVVFSHKILKWICEKHPTKFTQHDVHRALGSGRHKALQVRAGLCELERCNVLRLYETANNRTVCVVHPRAYY